ENYLVATGTGSGKTECFLFPIIDRLLRDPNLESPGVRAILIYPLNALANDQLFFRLAPLLLRHLGDPGIRFVRFTGAVRSSDKRSAIESKLLGNVRLMKVLGQPKHLSDNWLLARDEMLQHPPHILITNYAMLEHILLLPRNAGLFRATSLD